MDFLTPEQIADAIIKAASNTGNHSGVVALDPSVLRKAIADAIRQARLAEREACAKIADRYSDACGSQDERDIISARTGSSIAEEINSPNDRYGD